MFFLRSFSLFYNKARVCRGSAFARAGRFCAPAVKVLAFGLWMILFSGSAFAQEPPCERIERMNVSVAVQPDASVRVTEQITVQACRDQIKRGIFRMLPEKGLSGYEVLSVRRNGRPEPYRVRNLSNGLMVYIGDENTILSRGRQNYEISYRAFDVVRFQPDFDELYWNVTGNEWQFPIEHASVRVTLPAGAAIVPQGISLYTGYQNESGPAAARADGNLFFVTTRPLAPGEEFTVSAAFTKGVVQQPSRWEKYERAWKKYRPFLGPVLLVWLVLLGYYAVVWRRVGKDPASRVVRLLEPPAGLSPAQARYLRQMKYDTTTNTVIILSLVQKGCMQVITEGSRTFVLVQKEAPAQVHLPPEEQEFMAALFAKEQRVTLYRSNRVAFLSAQKAAQKALARWENGRYFARHLWANLPTLAFAVFLLWKYVKTGQGIMLPVQVWFCILFVFAWLYPTVKSFSEKKSSDATFYFSLLFALFLYALLGGVRGAVLAFVLLLPGGIFFKLVRAYTVAGRKQMDEIEGFLQYLQTAEKYRVFASDPTNASRIYCNHLPYAVALNVQNKWQQAFQQELGEKVLKQTEESAGMAFSHDAVAFTGLWAAASARPERSPSGFGGGSSGFGGGGSSGGGSGGGGGGGW